MKEFLKEPELILGMLNGMQDGLTILGADGTLLFVNDAFCNMLQFSGAELIGRKPPFPFWADDRSVPFTAVLQDTLSGSTVSVEATYRRKDNTYVDVLIAPAVLRDANGEARVVVSTIKDISERKRLERSLRASEQRWRAIAENPFDFVVLIDRNFRYAYVNHTAPGITEESLLGRLTPFDMVDAEYHGVMRAAFDETLATGKGTSYEVYSSALEAWYATIVGAVMEDGNVTALSLMSRDITQQKRAEEALERTEARLRDSHRIETVGRLAGGIAHDLNNMLTPILGYVDLAKRSLPQNHALQKHMQAIGAASHRARELVQRVLLFSRRQEPQKSAFDLRVAIEEDLILLRASLPAGIELIANFCTSAVPVLADRAQMSQVITNLFTNAVQAIQSSGGTLTIELSIDRDLHQAVLKVSDTGCGMDEPTVRRAFEPYFTTKAVGSGTGLGLSIAHSVISEHRGEISIQSVVGRGTTVSIRLPLTNVEAIRTDTAPSTTAPSTRPLVTSSRVLVVDDEAAVLELVKDLLQNGGYQVLTVSSAEAALDMLRITGKDIHLLLTDQSMPGMTGTQLVEKAKALYPALPCLMMTGLFDESLRRDAARCGVADVVTKPFNCDALLDAVNRAMNTAQGG